MEILESIKSQVNAHDGFIELGEIKDNKVVIHCGGECAPCDNKCIEEALKHKIPDIEVIFR
ncbi:MAG: NifU family protein [Nitrospirae bacterium]|nr:NifU family protein [Nitrospirota bacterium]